jgi:hypothetical protein
MPMSDPKPKLRMGFTGSRCGMTARQRSTFLELIGKLTPAELHVGDCVGSDTDAYNIVKSYDPEIPIIGHVPTNRNLSSHLLYDREMPPYDYLRRNRNIVDGSDYLVATPESTETQRSGTWYTIRYARKLKRKLYIIMRDGDII